MTPTPDPTDAALARTITGRAAALRRELHHLAHLLAERVRRTPPFRGTVR